MANSKIDYDFDELAATVEVEREAHAEYERLVKQPSDAIKAAHKDVCDEWREAKQLSEAARAAFHVACDAAVRQRLALLSQGTEAPEPTAPDGFTISVRAALQIEDPTAVPREFCMPDERKIKAALDSGTVVPGAALVPRYSIAVKGEK